MFVCSTSIAYWKKEKKSMKQEIKVHEVSWEVAEHLGAFPGEGLGMEGELESKICRQSSRENN